jgi:hypothetical protein
MSDRKLLVSPIELTDGLEELDMSVDHDFGIWHYSATDLTLSVNVGGGVYEIDLEKITNSAQMLDWIFQIHRKARGPNAVRDLVFAFQELFDPQAKLCSFGASRDLPKGFLYNRKRESKKRRQQEGI